MKYFEFGQENSELLVMLHGGGVSYRGMLPSAKELAKNYHVVLVAYDGFNPDEPETEFQSPMDEAKRLGDYLVEHYGGRVDILYGISYGCRVLMEVLADPRLTITTTIADGMGLNIRSKWGKDVYCFFFTHWVFLRGHGPSRSQKEEISRKDHWQNAGGGRPNPVRQGHTEKLEKSGLLPDRPQNRLFPVYKDGYVPLVRDQGHRGQKAVRQP